MTTLRIAIDEIEHSEPAYHIPAKRQKLDGDLISEKCSAGTRCDMARLTGFHFRPTDKKETINITFRSVSELSLSHVNRFKGRKKLGRRRLMSHFVNNDFITVCVSSSKIFFIAYTLQIGWIINFLVKVYITSPGGT